MIIVVINYYKNGDFVMVDIKKIEKQYFYKNKPVEYRLRKKTSINIYPILVEDWDMFEDSYSILNYEKNEIPSEEIIQMSYLEFVFKVLFTDEQNIVNFYNICSLCFHKKKEQVHCQYNENKKPVIIFTDKNNIITDIITSKDFDDLKKIILYQNINDYDDSYISKDIKEVIYKTIEVRNAGIKRLTLEDKMIFLGNKMGKTNEDLLKMTYREFSKRFDSAVEEMDYKINRTAELSGTIEFKKPLEHCVYKKEKNGYEAYFSDADSFVNKINNA